MSQTNALLSNIVHFIRIEQKLKSMLYLCLMNIKVICKTYMLYMLLAAPPPPLVKVSRTYSLVICHHHHHQQILLWKRFLLPRLSSIKFFFLTSYELASYSNEILFGEPKTLDNLDKYIIFNRDKCKIYLQPEFGRQVICY